MKTTVLALALAALALNAPAASAQKVRDSDDVWRVKVLRHEGRYWKPLTDFNTTTGPRFIFKDGRWYSSDLSQTWYLGQWVSVAEYRAAIAPRPIPEKPAPRGPVEG